MSITPSRMHVVDADWFTGYLHGMFSGLRDMCSGCTVVYGIFAFPHGQVTSWYPSSACDGTATSLDGLWDYGNKGMRIRVGSFSCQVHVNHAMMQAWISFVNKNVRLWVDPQTWNCFRLTAMFGVGLCHVGWEFAAMVCAKSVGKFCDKQISGIWYDVGIR